MSLSVIAKNHISRIDGRLKSCKDIHRKKNRLPAGHKDHELYKLAIMGAVVASFSEIENYIEIFLFECFEKSLKSKDYSDFLKSKNHKNLKAHLFAEMFKGLFHYYSFKKEEPYLIDKLVTSKYFNGILENKPFDIKGSIVLAGGKKYPSPKNIDVVGKRLGLNNIFAEMSRVHPAPWEDKIRNLSETRSGIAHRGELPSGYSSSDAVTFISDCIVLLKILDKTLKNHFKSHLRPKDWKMISKL